MLRSLTALAGVLLISLLAPSTLSAQGGHTVSEDELVRMQGSFDPYAPGLLIDWRDVFGDQADFNLGGAAFFRRRGLDNQYSDVYLMGIPTSDIEDGWSGWGSWGGLNHVINNKGYGTEGLAASTFTLAGFAGDQWLDVRAGNQREGLQVAYANSNRTYRHRWMATYNTGWMKGGWAVSMSASKRFAEEAYEPGTFYDAYSYFLSVEKRMGLNHSLSLTAFGAPTRRGRPSAAPQVMFDMADDPYYNPSWGYQNGEKRSGKITEQHLPMFILTHDWSIRPQSRLLTSVSYQFGKDSYGTLDWYNAADPRPDYYRKLPTFLENEQPQLAQDLFDYLAANPEEMQLDWDRFYRVNTLAPDTVFNANGTGETVTGNASNYFFGAQRSDKKRFNASVLYDNAVSDILSVQAGGVFQYQNTNHYRLMEDLLGGDFHINLNQFAEQDFPGDQDIAQNDLNNPNGIVGEGDRYMYDYNAIVQRERLWGQALLTFPHVDVNVGGEVSHTRFRRIGNMRNGFFPDNSFGASEAKNFVNYAVRAGLTYKINGRNYVVANARYETRAPLFENAYVSPRIRHDLAAGLESERNYGAELGFIHRSRKVKLNVMAYYLSINDQTDLISFYHDDFRTFVNLSLTNIDRRQYGLELGAQYNITEEVGVSAAAAWGQNLFVSRFDGTYTADNTAALESLPPNFDRTPTIYSKNFHVANTPELATTFGINYRSRHGFFANLNFNYTDRIWMDFYPIRRTTNAVEGVGADETALLNDIVDQEMVDGQFTMDFFGGYTWYMRDAFPNLKRGYNMMFLLGVQNLTNNQDFIRYGYEQNRFDYVGQDLDRFPTKYYYGRGTTYFASVTFRM